MSSHKILNPTAESADWWWWQLNQNQRPPQTTTTAPDLVELHKVRFQKIFWMTFRFSSEGSSSSTNRTWMWIRCDSSRSCFERAIWMSSDDFPVQISLELCGDHSSVHSTTTCSTSLLTQPIRDCSPDPTGPR